MHSVYLKMDKIELFIKKYCESILLFWRLLNSLKNQIHFKLKEYYEISVQNSAHFIRILANLFKKYLTFSGIYIFMNL